jgi:uncharacterized protein YbjT (DUF2867 family)
VRIVVGAAAGHIGRRTAEKLITAGAETVLVVRSVEKVAQLVNRGASAVAIDLADGPAVTKASADADAIFWLTPPNLTAEDLRKWQTQTAGAAAMAVRENGIAHVVNVSTIGADRSSCRSISVMGEVEEILSESCANVVHLRPGYFMENLLNQAVSLRTKREFYFPYAPDHDLPWVSTDDIGDIAAEYLLDARWNGHCHRDLMGPANLTPVEVAENIARVCGHPVNYVQIPIDSFIGSLKSAGASQDVQEKLGELLRELGDPQGIYSASRRPEASTATTIEEFASLKLLPAMRASGKTT